MKVLIVGGGGREHALAWKIAQSYLKPKIYLAPGNAGTSGIATNIGIAANDIEGLLAFATQNKIDYTIVGPEEPLVNGIVDLFKKAGLAIYGPTRAAAALEGSKVFAKELLAKYNIPTAPFKVFDDPSEAAAYASLLEYPIVVKADGLVAGKGVIICKNSDEARAAIKLIMIEKKFGAEAGKKIIIENFIDGEEASYIVMTDKYGNILPLASSQDHKRAFDGDEGPNTGGMGAYSPAPVVTDEVERKILDRIIRPVVRAMYDEGRPFIGFPYAGLMIKDGEPYVLEFNARLGDPETQPILYRMKTDLLQLIIAALDGDLDEESNIEWDPDPAVCVVMAADGYPGKYEKGFPVQGIKWAEKDGAVVFHAGTALDGDGNVMASGGRVLGVTASGEDFARAIVNAYWGVTKIECDRLVYRTDIGQRAVEREAVK